MVDHRNCLKIMTARLSFDELNAQVMPSLYDLTHLEADACEYSEDGYLNLPPLLNLSFESMQDTSAVHLLDDGFRLYLYLGS